MRRPELAALVATHGPAKRISELAEQWDAYTNEPITDPMPVLKYDCMPDSGYTATKPIPLSPANTAGVMEIDEHGPKFSLVVKDGTPDLHRTMMRAMYARLKRERKPRMARPKPEKPNDR